MTKPIVYSLAAACSLVLTGVSASAQLLIGVDFPGRVDYNDPNSNPPHVATPGEVLESGDFTGVFGQSNFNAIDFALQETQIFTTPTLVDSTGAATAVTLSVTSNDSWNADVDTSAPFGELMDGIIKGQTKNGVSGVLTFQFNNVPAGIYQLVAYTLENPNADPTANIDTTVAGTGITYTTIEGSGSGTSTFTRAFSTDPAARDLGNYVQFDNIIVTDGTVLLTATHAGGTDGIGVAGLQLQQVPEPTAFLMLASGAGMLGMLRRRRS